MVFRSVLLFHLILIVGVLMGGYAYALADCTGTDISTCDMCDVSDMNVEIRAPDDVTSTGWLSMSYDSSSGTCPPSITETWKKNYGYTFCPQEGTYDARVRAYAQGDSYEWETSSWSTLYTVNYDTDSNWCGCNGSTWFSTVSGGSNGQCCGDDSGGDDFYYYNASPTTATVLSCKRCLNGAVYGPVNLYGNGYWWGTDPTTDTSGTCYYGDITCTAASASNGTSQNRYGNGYLPIPAPGSEDIQNCYYGDITCSDGSSSNGASQAIFGWGWSNTSNPAKVAECKPDAAVCVDGSYANASSQYIYGNGADFGTTCYYGSWGCGSGQAVNGTSCSLRCSGVGSECCENQSTYTSSITCTDAGCGFTVNDRDDAEAYCTASGNGCTPYSWNIGGNYVNGNCCGDDPNENRHTRVCYEGACTNSTTDDACRTDTTSCIYSSTVYANGYVGDVDSDGENETCVSGIWNITVGAPAGCAPPASGDWNLTESCTFNTTDTVAGNLIINSGVTLTIGEAGVLQMDLSSYYILIRYGGTLYIRRGGVIR